MQSVLREIKKLPDRRVAGARAEAFLLNPYSALGQDAVKVIDESQFEAAKEKAGVKFEWFRPLIRADAVGYPFEVGIEIDGTAGETNRRFFATDEELEDFVTGLANRLSRRMQLYAWQEYEFELTGDSHDHSRQLADALEVRRKPAIAIDHSRVFDISNYTDRIRGIGEDEPFISPYIVKKSEDGGWFPTNLLVLLKLRTVDDNDDVTVPLTPDDLNTVSERISQAVADGAENIKLDSCPIPLPVGDLEKAINEVCAAFGAQPEVWPKDRGDA